VTGALLLLSPISPCDSGNGLAMRAAGWVRAARAEWDPHVAVVPVAGELRFCPRPVTARTFVVPPLDRAQAAHRWRQLLTDPFWRSLLGQAEPMPRAALVASPTLAEKVIETGEVAPGTPVLAIRSYLAPLAIAVARILGSPWTALDLDDDDEVLERAQGHEEAAEAYRRLVATFAQHFGSISLASEAEASAVATRLGRPASVVPNGVEVPRTPPRHTGRSASVLFVGNLTYPPNRDAAKVLVRDVLPELRSALGVQVKAEIVGDFGDDVSIGALANVDGVHLAGFAENLTQYYANASAVIAPINVGGGTRIKLLEAFAFGVPVITTPTGAAGLSVRDEEHLLLGSTPSEMAAAAARVLGSRSLGLTISQAARSLVASRHSWPVVDEIAGRFLADARDAAT